MIPFGVDPSTDWTASYPMTQPQSGQQPPTLRVTATDLGWDVAQSGAAGLVAGVASGSPIYNVSRADGTLLSAQIRPPELVNASQCGETLGGPLTGGMWPECPGCCLRATQSLLPNEQVPPPPTTHHPPPAVPTRQE
jgi:hypothetical protein